MLRNLISRKKKAYWGKPRINNTPYLFLIFFIVVYLTTFFSSLDYVTSIGVIVFRLQIIIKSFTIPSR